MHVCLSDVHSSVWFHLLWFCPSGLQRNLKASEEKRDMLTKDKNKLENDIMDVMKSSGDSSAQLTKMNEELNQKERSAATLRNIFVKPYCRVILLCFDGLHCELTNLCI